MLLHLSLDHWVCLRVDNDNHLFVLIGWGGVMWVGICMILTLSNYISSENPCMDTIITKLYEHTFGLSDSIIIMALFDSQQP